MSVSALGSKGPIPVSIQHAVSADAIIHSPIFAGQQPC
jgi:hypothetical protein